MKKTIFMGLVIGAIAIAMVAAGSSSVIPVTATHGSPHKDNAQGGLNNADDNVHENTDSTPEDLSEQDVRFHEGTCQGGHSTDVLDEEFGGCDAIGDPGESDNNRQDDE
jgi:hypothetical protein